jgi:hypothetical protein
MATCSERDHDLMCQTHITDLGKTLLFELTFDASGPQGNSLNYLAIGCGFKRISNNLPCACQQQISTQADSPY